MTTDQKRRFITLVKSGQVDIADFAEIPDRNFARTSPVIRHEIDPQISDMITCDPETVFVCKEDGKAYTFGEIQEMASGESVFCHVEISDGTEGLTETERWKAMRENPPVYISGIQLSGISKEQRIETFLNNHYQ